MKRQKPETALRVPVETPAGTKPMTLEVTFQDRDTFNNIVKYAGGLTRIHWGLIMDYIKATKTQLVRVIVM